MFIHNIDPVLFTIGAVQIRYYGLFYAIGFIIALYMIPWLAKQRKEDISSELIQEFIVYVIVGIVIGARLFYVLFYNFMSYMQNPIEILMIWKGGLSFHGGLVGAMIVSYLFCKKKNVSFYKLADLTVIPLALGLALGRIANFFNGELWGRITDLPWAVKFKNVDGYRHPSQLYESMKNLFIFFVLFFNRKKKFPDGFFFWNFVFLYGVLRFIIEFLREPDAQLGFIAFGLSMGQLLSLAMVLVAGYYLFLYWKKHKACTLHLFK